MVVFEGGIKKGKLRGNVCMFTDKSNVASREICMTHNSHLVATRLTLK
jgi:hypothetical protein